MAEELEISWRLYGKKNALLFGRPDGFALVKADMGGDEKIEHTQLLSTSWTQLDVGALDQPGWSYWVNDTTDKKITVAADSGGTNVLFSIPPGLGCLLHLETLTLYARVDSGTGAVSYGIAEGAAA